MIPTQTGLAICSVQVVQHFTDDFYEIIFEYPIQSIHLLRNANCIGAFRSNVNPPRPSKFINLAETQSLLKKSLRYPTPHFRHISTGTHLFYHALLNTRLANITSKSIRWAGVNGQGSCPWSMMALSHGFGTLRNLSDIQTTTQPSPCAARQGT